MSWQYLYVKVAIQKKKAVGEKLKLKMNYTRCFNETRN